MSGIKGSLTVEQRQKVPTQLDGLNATNFSALKACDTQCKLLERCLRFVFISSPSDACPTEYRDYQERIDSVLTLLAELQQIEASSKEALQRAEILAQSRRDVEELEKSSGSTGGRVAVLRAKTQQLEQNLSQNLSSIDAKVKDLVSRETEVSR